MNFKEVKLKMFYLISVRNNEETKNEECIVTFLGFDSDTPIIE